MSEPDQIAPRDTFWEENAERLARRVLVIAGRLDLEELRILLAMDGEEVEPLQMLSETRAMLLNLLPQDLPLVFPR
jgi:hypothetical protein